MGASFAGRAAVFFMAVCGVIGIHSPFFPLWLAAKGLDPKTIGFALAVPQIVRLAAIPASTHIADRYDAIRGVIVGCALAMTAGYALLGFAQDTFAIFILFALASFFYTPVMTLTDAYALKGLAQHGRAYGPIRLWGSVAFIAGMFAAGGTTDAVPSEYLIWLIVAGMGLTAMAALWLRPLHAHVSEAVSTRRSLLRNPAFIAVIAAASLIQASHAAYYGFSTLDWMRKGYDGTSIAALWTVGVAVEIALFAYQARLPSFATPVNLMLLGAACATIRWAAMALDPASPWVLPWLQLLHGLSYGATHLGALSLVTAIAPARQGAAAQGHLAVLMGLAMAAAMAVSGWLYANAGSAAYGAMALVAAGGGACALVANKLRPHVAV